MSSGLRLYSSFRTKPFCRSRLKGADAESGFLFKKQTGFRIKLSFASLCLTKRKFLRNDGGGGVFYNQNGALVWNDAFGSTFSRMVPMGRCMLALQTILRVARGSIVRGFIEDIQKNMALSNLFIMRNTLRQWMPLTVKKSLRSGEGIGKNSLSMISTLPGEICTRICNVEPYGALALVGKAEEVRKA